MSMTAARLLGADDPPPGSERAQTYGRWLVILIPVVIVVVGGWAHRWVAEDAFIDFRVVHNLLAGHGPVFNVGERVEVYTDPLWVFILAAVRLVAPFIPIEWSSVLLGLTFTAGGFLFGGLAAQRLAERRGVRVALPLGMLTMSAVAGVWDFASSGLETGLTIGWMGLSFWLLTRTAGRGRGATATAFVAGLGFLIRPDLALVSLALLGGLGCVIASSNEPSSGWKRRWLVPVLAAAALPLLYQLWRMAYFGLLVPNTALAKSASSTWWSQGWTYLVDFVSPYWLWLPIAILVGITLKRAYGWWGDGDRLTCLLMAAPFVGGLLDALYVVSIGGDFMHARMLIPGFFGVSLALWIEVPRTTPDRVALGAVLVWAVVCVVGLRYGEQLINPSTGIANERTYYIAASGQEHPITLSDYASSNWKRYGDILRQIADRSGTSAIDHAVLTPQPMALPTLPIEPPVIVEGRPPGPAQLVAPVFNIGISGDAAGPGVYLYDELSLANPISSHFTLETHGRPGHEKGAPLVWMFARFGGSRAIADYDEALAVNDNQPTPPPQTAEAAITDARLALSCQPLAGYLHAISSPFSLGAAFSDLFHSYTWTTMTFDSNPTSAKLELCLQSPLGSTIGRASMRGR